MSTEVERPITSAARGLAVGDRYVVQAAASASGFRTEYRITRIDASGWVWGVVVTKEDAR